MICLTEMYNSNLSEIERIGKGIGIFTIIFRRM